MRTTTIFSSRWLAGLAFLAIPSLLADQSGIRVWWAGAYQSVGREDVPTAATGERISLSGARGEAEAFQLVLQSEAGAREVSIEPQPLQRDGGKAPVIGASAFAWNPVGYVEVAGGAKGNTWVADPLLPSRHFELKPARNQPVWITLRIPPNAPAGAYRGRLLVRAGGSRIAVPVSLTVFDFSLPAAMPIFIQGNIWYEDLARWLKQHNLYSEERMVALAKAYLRNAAEHGCNAVPSPFLDDSPRFEEVARFAFDELHYRRFRFPGAMVDSGAGYRSWRGRPIFILPAEDGDQWLNASTPAAEHLASTVTGVRFTANWGIRLSIGNLDAQPFNGSWLEYAFETPRAGEYHVWTDAQHIAAEEVWVDGRRVGEIPKRASRFSKASGSIALPAGKHRLRLEFQQLTGHASDVVRWIFVSPRPDANPRLLYEQRRLNPEFVKPYLASLEEEAAKLRRLGWLDKAMLKLWDEPMPESYSLVRELYQQARQALPGVKTEITKIPAPELRGPIDIWTFAGEHNPSAADLAECRARGEEVWFYYNTLHTVPSPPWRTRMIGWLLWRFALDGYHFWAVNSWVEDPWTVPVGAVNSFFRGTFLYPDPASGAPLNSVRWEQFRKGLDDYQYFRLLKEQLEGPGASRKDAAEGKALLAEIDTLFPDFKKLPTDPLKLLQIRERVGQWLSQGR